MKTKNDLKTGILIGIGMIVVPLLLMSTTYTTEKKNKYELHVSGTSIGNVYRLNTETGTVDYINKEYFSNYKTYTIDGSDSKCWNSNGVQINCDNKK